LDTHNLVQEYSDQHRRFPFSTLAFVAACILVVLLNMRWVLRGDILQLEEPILKEAITIILTICMLSFILFRDRILEFLFTALLHAKSALNQELDLRSILRVNSLRVFKKRFIELQRGGKIRIVSILSLSGHPIIPTGGDSMGRNLYLYEALFNRLTDLFLALRTHGMQFAYLTSLLPFESKRWNTDRKIRDLEDELSKMNEAERAEARKVLLEIERLKENKLGHCYRGVVLMALWVDEKEASIEQGRRKIEELTRSLILSLGAVFPEMEVTQLQGASLLNTICGFLFPQESFQEATSLQQKKSLDSSPFLSLL